MTKNKGFTLIELVVVIMILGILAAVAAPKLLGTSQRANENAAKQTLSVVRDAIERHAAEHGGQPPANVDVILIADELIRSPVPSCPVGSLNANVAAGDAARSVIAGGAGWAYHATSGEFYINHAGTDDDGVAYNDY